MDLGFIGLGKMGLNMVTRLTRGGHHVVAYDRSTDAVRHASSVGATGAGSLEELISGLRPPRAVWLMIPAGAPTESTVNALADRLSPGDVIVDGGNSNFHDDISRAERLKAKSIEYVDAGVSGGIWGLEEGYCLMVGGEMETCRRLEPIFLTLAPPKGYLRVGSSGAGHYVKMVHNGIEYGLMQAYAEGFELLHASSYQLDVAGIAGLWGHGSVVRSWLLELTTRALASDPDLKGLKAYVEDSGEGRWMVQEAVDRAVPLSVITSALFTRFQSREDNPFGARLLAALRQQFGGHSVQKVSSDK